MNIKSMSFREYAGRALIFGGLGKLGGLERETLVTFALGAPIGEKLLGTSLEEIIVNAIEEYVKNNQGRLLDPQPIDSTQVPTATHENFSEVPVQSVVQTPTPSHHFETKNDGKWLELIPHPSVVEILGRRGSGKSALGHRLLELSRFRSLPYVLGMSQHIIKDLPNWLGVINGPDEAPFGATLLIDEAQLAFNARDSQKQKNREIGDIIWLSRQRQQTLIFVSQQARTLDKNIASTPDVIIIKEPEPLQVKFERREISEIIKLAAKEFHNIKKDRMKWSLVYSPACNFCNMLTNELPSYWNDRLSKAYAIAGPTIEHKPAHNASKAEKIKRAKTLNNMGIPVPQIKAEIGVRSRTTVYKYIAMPDNDIQQK